MSESESLDEIAVATEILAAKILQKPPPAPDHLEKSPLGMVILLVDLQMLSQFPYPGSKYGNLNFRRTCIRGMNLELLYDALFLLLLKHFLSPLAHIFPKPSDAGPRKT